MISPAPQRITCAGLVRMSEAVRAATIIILALVMLARALVPAGFMPERNAQTGVFVVAMCSGKADHQTITVHLPGAPAKKDDGRKECPFATTITPVESGPQPLPPPTSVHFRADYTPALGASPVVPMRRPSAPPTGPPAFA